jgi:hypothetical protein
MWCIHHFHVSLFNHRCISRLCPSVVDGLAFNREEWSLPIASPDGMDDSFYSFFSYIHT